RHRDNGRVAASRGPRPVAQPALAHVRLRDAGGVMLRGGDVVDQRHRFRVPAPRTHLSQPLTIADSLECPPVRQMHGHAIKRLPAQQSSSREFPPNPYPTCTAPLPSGKHWTSSQAAQARSQRVDPDWRLADAGDGWPVGAEGADWELAGAVDGQLG